MGQRIKSPRNRVDGRYGVTVSFHWAGRSAAKTARAEADAFRVYESLVDTCPGAWSAAAK